MTVTHRNFKYETIPAVPANDALPAVLHVFSNQ